MPVRKRLEAMHHPIQVVVRWTGLSADVLRAWERRYAAVSPGRSETGRRLYSDADIERLILLKRATESGRSIGQVATMAAGDLSRMLDQDAASLPVPPPEPGSHPGPDRNEIARCLRCVERFDEPNLRAALREAALALPLARLIDTVLAPLLQTIGDRWRDGTLRISHEHFATNTIETFLAETMRLSGSPRAWRIVVTTPSGQRHRIGALLAAATAVTAGWDAVFLGADLPAEDIADAVVRAGARAVALSIVSAGDDPHLSAELTRLRTLLPEGVALFIGGAWAGAHRDVLKKIGAEAPAGFEVFRSKLASLATGSNGE